MPQYDIDTVLGWRGNTVRDRTGEKIGTVGDVFLDRQTDRPAWVGVKTGFFGSKQSYVSLTGVEAVADELRLPYDAELVKNAPQIEPDISLTEEEEQALYRHYGEEYEPFAGVPVEPSDGPGLGEDAMTRSEEEVRLGHSERRPTERVRIKKVMVTENVRKVVPVQREVIQLEHEPPPEGGIESAEDVPEQR